MNSLYDQEIPKYRKTKPSDISKAKKKSKHKHHYEECLIRYKEINSVNQEEITCASLKSYCTICGKINEMMKDSIVTDYKIKETISNGQTYYHYMTNEELYKRYHDKLPVFFVENRWKDDYVDLEQDHK